MISMGDFRPKVSGLQDFWFFFEKFLFTAIVGLYRFLESKTSQFPITCEVLYIECGMLELVSSNQG